MTVSVRIDRVVLPEGMSLDRDELAEAIRQAVASRAGLGAPSGGATPLVRADLAEPPAGEPVTLAARIGDALARAVLR
jgi:hypothetical protein